jgi:glycosyltransferase involved in cell wall biosynthesis
VLPPSLIKRHRFYEKHRNDYHVILCFGNVPPSLKMPCKVYTYFHNLSILQPPLTYSKRRKIKFALKRYMIRILSRNTDAWIVQTDNTKTMVKEYLREKRKPLFVYPIYNLPKIVPGNEPTDRKDYLFIGDYTFSKGHDMLIRAWEKLYEIGKHYVLHLTVDRRPVTEPFCQKLDTVISKGVPIINHGFLPFDKVGIIYSRCKAIVYPSQLESLGLGIVEGISVGCDVIASNLAYVHSICIPSETFDPFDVDSIVNAILRYEEGHSQKSKLTIHDCSQELIELLRS